MEECAKGALKRRDGPREGCVGGYVGLQYGTVRYVPVPGTDTHGRGSDLPDAISVPTGTGTYRPYYRHVQYLLVSL
jgi:hypothetical protein